MSGSPIIAYDGSTVGLISASGDDRRKYAYCTGLRRGREYGGLSVWFLPGRAITLQPTEILQSNNWQDVLERVA